jgi:hypothetical protein
MKWDFVVEEAVEFSKRAYLHSCSLNTVAYRPVARQRPRNMEEETAVTEELS